MYICPHYNLEVIYPLITREWHPDNKGSIRDYSGKNAKWRCFNNYCGCHEWECRISNRTSLGYGCPILFRKKKMYSYGN
jgi:hypothetical protein